MPMLVASAVLGLAWTDGETQVVLLHLLVVVVAVAVVIVVVVVLLLLLPLLLAHRGLVRLRTRSWPAVAAVVAAAAVVSAWVFEHELFLPRSCFDRRRPHRRPRLVRGARSARTSSAPASRRSRKRAGEGASAWRQSDGRAAARTTAAATAAAASGDVTPPPPSPSSSSSSFDGQVDSTRTLSEVFRVHLGRISPDFKSCTW